MAEVTGPGPLVTVRLLQFPVDLWARADSETRDLLREFVLISIDQEHDVPRQLLALVNELQQGYGSMSTAQTARLEAARAAGEDVIAELTYEVPAEIGAGVLRLGQLLDEADEYCRRGEHLLSLASSQSAKAFREWFLEEFSRQLAGEEPIPWPASDHALALQGASGE